MQTYIVNVYVSVHLLVMIFFSQKVLFCEHKSQIDQLLYGLWLADTQYMHCSSDFRESEDWSGCCKTRFLFSEMPVFKGLNLMEYFGACQHVLDFSIISIMGRHDCCGGSWSSFTVWRSNNSSSVRQTRFNVRG